MNIILRHVMLGLVSLLSVTTFASEFGEKCRSEQFEIRIEKIPSEYYSTFERMVATGRALREESRSYCDCLEMSYAAHRMVSKVSLNEKTFLESKEGFQKHKLCMDIASVSHRSLLKRVTNDGRR